MGVVLQPGDIVVTKRAITRGPNENGIQAGTIGIVVSRGYKEKIGVQFERTKNETTPTVRCFVSNLQPVA